MSAEEKSAPILSIVPLLGKPACAVDERDAVEVHVSASNETEVTKAVLKALASRGDVFQRSKCLVEPQLDPARMLPGLLRPTEELRMSVIKTARARALAAETCTFTRGDRDGEPCPCGPPDYIATALLASPDYWTEAGIPVVESIAENPTLRADGTIHDRPGHDPNTGNFFAPDDGVTYPAIPDAPTKEQARAAYDVLMDPFFDFPFVEDHDRSVVAAAILTMLARPAIPGPTPPFVLRTPTPRTGKDLCTDAMTIIGTGRPTPGRSLPVDDERELKKLLLSLGLAGVRVVSFGNCEGGIGSAVLSHAVTREVISDRFLGGNIDMTVAIRPVWLFNGNNPYYKGDFGPRVVLSNMDAKVADPQARKGFKYDPLLPHVRSERPRLVAAGLTILRAYCVAGRPLHGKSKKGSFEGWDDLIRGALIWAGVADPLAGDAAVRTTDDADLEQLAALLSAWQAAFGSTPTTLSAAVDASRAIGFATTPAKRVELDPEKRANLAAAFAALDAKLGDRYSAAALRYRFRHHKGRPVDIGGNGLPGETLRLLSVDDRTGSAKVNAWCVLADAASAVPPPPPPPPPPQSWYQSLLNR